MSEGDLIELAEYGALILGPIVLLVIVILIARASNKMSAGIATFTKERGLVRRRGRTGNVMTAHTDEEYFEGNIDGVPVQLHATRATMGRTTRYSCRAMGRCPAPTPRQFALQIEYMGNAPDRVLTGDPNFDRAVCVQSDARDLVFALLADPYVRGAINRAAWKMRKCGLVYDRGVVTLSGGIYPISRSDVEDPLMAVVACCRARF